METKKISLLGNAGVGKTKWVHSLMGSHINTYNPTLGVEVHPYTKDGRCFNIWDIAGDPRYCGLGDGYLVGSDHALIMWDTIETPMRWINMCNQNNLPYTLIPNTSLNFPTF